MAKRIEEIKELEAEAAGIPYPDYVDAVAQTYHNRFSIMKGFHGISHRTGIVCDRETGVEYFASIDRDYVLTIGSPVIKKQE